jgi:hypothetical protein
MTIDTHYIPAFSIEEVILDKDTGAPLSGGLVYFWRDSQRTQPKDVWQITGSSPNYTFIRLPNPMELSSIGTFVDSLGNPTVPYFLPWVLNDDDEPTEVPDYYYVVVTSSLDVEQFTRESVPYIPQELDPGENAIAYTNELSNPQFAQVLFDTVTNSHVYTFTSATLAVASVAPGWDLVVTGTGTVTVSQTTPLGSLNVPTNPGTLLNIDSSGSLTVLRLRQRLNGSPNLFGDGNISATFIAKTFAGTPSTLTMKYQQSSGMVVPLTIASAVLSGTYTSFTGQLDVPVSTSIEDFPDAYVDIYFDIPISTNIEITSIQIVATGSVAVADVPYDQISNERQLSDLMWYYKPQLVYKPIPSWLVGWDFPLNPAQPLGETVAASAIGANKSKYVWDQTIVFQSADSGVGVDRVTVTQAFRMTAAVTTQMAVIQYLPSPQAVKITHAPIAVNIAASRSGGADINATVSLWYTSGSLPNVAPGTNNSLVTALDANGFPTVSAGWAEVPRLNNVGNAQFTLKARTTREYPDHSFTGWDLEGLSVTPTFFAIVIGTASVASTRTIEILSVGLCSGEIATRPAPQTPDQVLRECERYFEMTFNPGDVPGTTVTDFGCLDIPQNTKVVGGDTFLYPSNFSFPFMSSKESPSSTAMQVYSPVLTGAADAVNVGFYNGASGFSGSAERTFSTNWNFVDIGQSGFGIAGKISASLISLGSASNFAQGTLRFHWTASSRLGIEVLT